MVLHTGLIFSIVQIAGYRTAPDVRYFRILNRAGTAVLTYNTAPNFKI